MVEYPILAVNTHNLGANAGPLFVSGDSDATLAHPGDRRELSGTFYELDLDYGTSETDFTARIVSDINAKLQPDERLQWGTLTTSEPIQLQNRLTLPLTIQLIADPRDLPPLFDAMPLEVQTTTVTIWEDVTEVQLGLISDHDRHSCLIFPDLANRAHLDILHTNFLTAGTQQFSVTETQLPDTHRTRFNQLEYSSGHDSHTLRGFYDILPQNIYSSGQDLLVINQPYTTAPALPDLRIPGVNTAPQPGINIIYGGIYEPDNRPNIADLNVRPTALNPAGINIFEWSLPLALPAVEPLNTFIVDNLPGGTLLYWTIICWVLGSVVAAVAFAMFKSPMAAVIGWLATTFLVFSVGLIPAWIMILMLVPAGFIALLSRNRGGRSPQQPA